MRPDLPGRQGTRILKWKYALVRKAILQALRESGGSLEYRELPAAVAERLSAAERKRLGSVSWYTTTVKLDMEVRGEIRRTPGARPQRLEL